MKTAIELIAAERQRQLQDWTPAHDDLHDRKELVRNAEDVLGAYLVGKSYGPRPPADQWGLGKKYKEDPLRLLVIAGALVAAEIERLQRAQPEPQPGGEEGV